MSNYRSFRGWVPHTVHTVRTVHHSTAMPICARTVRLAQRPMASTVAGVWTVNDSHNQRPENSIVPSLSAVRQSCGLPRSGPACLAQSRAANRYSRARDSPEGGGNGRIVCLSLLRVKKFRRNAQKKMNVKS